MAKKNNGSVMSEETPVCQFHRELTDRHAENNEKLDASQIKVEGWEITRAYAICSLAKSEETFQYYRDLNNFELFDMKDSSEIIKGNIDEHVKQDGVLGESIKEVSKLLNDLKAKLHDANNAACTMRNCLQSHLGFKDDDVPDHLKDITSSAKALGKDGKKAADAMAMVAGIHTFSDLETLQPFAKNLTGILTELKASTDSFINDAQAKEKEAQDELNELLKELNKEEFESFRIGGTVNAEKCTHDFICKGKCEPIECVEVLCKNLGACDGGLSGYKSSGQASHEYSNKKYDKD